jgi:hypothetical protein
MASPTDSQNTKIGAATATVYKLLASHTKDPSSISKCLVEGSLASSRLQRSKNATKMGVAAHEYIYYIYIIYIYEYIYYIYIIYIYIYMARSEVEMKWESSP